MIKKYKKYIKEQIDNHSELDPFGEEDWDAIEGYLVKKLDETSGNGERMLYYFGLLRKNGILHHLAIGEIFRGGCSSEYFNAMEDWPYKELTEDEKVRIFNDEIGISCFIVNDITTSEFKEYTLSEISEIFGIKKEEINL